jgi:hypothetical protein
MLPDRSGTPDEQQPATGAPPTGVVFSNGETRSAADAADAADGAWRMAHGKLQQTCYSKQHTAHTIIDML